MVTSDGSRDKRWYIVADPTSTPFPSRDAAARAERVAAAMAAPQAPELLFACQEALKAINSHTTEPLPVGVYNRVALLLSDAIDKPTD